MTALLRQVLSDRAMADALAASGLETIRERHTCRHRIDELLAILADHGSARVIDQLAPKEAAQ
jgi:spore maturation protein CgeB